MDRTTCVVVGGGPAGMMLGLLLARGGVEVTVLEKHKDFLRDFRGDTVHPSTIRLLGELGLGPAFDAIEQSRIDRMAFPVTDGEPVLMADYSRLGPGTAIAMVPQWDLLNLLADTAAAEPTFTLRTETEVTGLLRDGERVTGVAYRTADGTTGELAADLTVAGDGRWSVVRREAGLSVTELPMPIDAWWFRLPRHEGETASALEPGMAPGRIGVVIPRSDYFQIAYLARKGTDAQLRARGLDAFRRDVAEVLPFLADRVGDIASMDDVKHLDARLNRLTRWHRPGVLCIGDAAHAMSPMGGVGINLAIQDAVATATLLTRSLRDGTLTDRKVGSVRRRRLLPTILVQRLQQMMHRAIVEPVVDARRTGPPTAMVTLMRRFPWLSVVPAYLIGYGFRPEHAPAFARRAAAPAPAAR